MNKIYAVKRVIEEGKYREMSGRAQFLQVGFRLMPCVDSWMKVFFARMCVGWKWQYI
jgi:hypothetical protein